MTNVQMIQNEFEWVIRGEIDLAVAAVTANRGSNQVAARTGVGTYTVTIKGNHGLKLVEILERQVSWQGAVPTTALGCRISSVVQTAGTDDIVITIKTMANPTSGADTDNTVTSPTLSYKVVLRVGKMGNPL